MRKTFVFIRKYRYILLIIVIATFFLFPLLQNSLYNSHDGEAHVARFAAYFQAFRDGQIIPRWAGNLNYGYGSPLFIFFYPLPGYIASLLHLFNLSFEVIFKILIYLSFILSPIFLFVWLRKYAKEEIAFVASVIYMLAPYRFLDTFVRGDIAEMLSFVFIPAIFYYIDKSIKQNAIKDVIWGAIFYSLFILSHNGIALIFTPVFLAYGFIYSKDIKKLFYPIFIIVFGLMLSSFFWLPSILEGKYVLSKLIVENVYKSNFIDIPNLIYSKWGFAPELHTSVGQSPQLGILYAFIPFLAIIFWKHFVKYKRMLFFWMIIFLISVFMVTPYSKTLWENLPLIKLMGYPWRFIALASFSLAMIAFYILKKIDRKIYVYIILLIFIISSIQYVKVSGYSYKNDNFYLGYKGTTDYHMRTSTVWTAGDFSLVSRNNIEIISGKGVMKNMFRKSNQHSFILQANTPVQILDNTVYFPGWRVEIDGNKVPIEFQDMNHRGLITFYVKQGIHDVKIFFSETPLRLLSDMISISGLVLIMMYFLSKKFEIIKFKT